MERKVVETINRKIQQINFGECQYFPDTAKISIKGKISHISPTPARILVFLSNNQNNTLTLNDIKKHVWPKKYNDVADLTVHAHLSALRKALGDNHKPHRYIVCNKNWTYQLKPLAKVIYTKPKQSRNSLALKVVAFSLLSAIGATVLGFTYMQQQPPFYIMSSIKQLTTFKGAIDFTTVSPNKQILVFAHKKEGASNWGLIAKQRNSERYNTLKLDKAPLMHNMEPSFSPNGKKLSWVRTNYQKHCMVMIADFIEAELKIENELEILDCSQNFYARFPQWKDENTLLASLPQGNNQVNAIFEINLDTLNTKKITDPEDFLYGELGLFYNKNNKKLAHLRRSNIAGFWSELMIYDFNTEQDKLLKAYTYPLYSVAWIDETRLLAKSETGFEVITLDGEVSPIEHTNSDEGFMPFSLGDEKFGFINGDLAARDIEVINLRNKTVNKDLSSIRHDFRPVVAKKSGDFAFASKRSGYRQIYATVNGIPKQITQFENYLSIAAMAISPDGELIAFVVNSQLNIIDKSGQSHYKEDVAVSGISFTLDGKGLLYGAESHGGWKIQYLPLFADNAKKPFTVTHGYMPKSGDDGFVYFLRKMDGVSTLYRKPFNTDIDDYVDVDVEADIQELGSAPFQSINSNSYDVVNNHLYYVMQNNKTKILVSQNIATGETLPISSVSNSIFSLNHDATILIASKEDEAQNNLVEFKLLQSTSN